MYRNGAREALLQRKAGTLSTFTIRIYYKVVTGLSLAFESVEGSGSILRVFGVWLGSCIGDWDGDRRLLVEGRNVI